MCGNGPVCFSSLINPFAQKNAARYRHNVTLQVFKASAGLKSVSFGSTVNGAGIRRSKNFTIPYIRKCEKDDQQ